MSKSEVMRKKTGAVSASGDERIGETCSCNQVEIQRECGYNIL